MLPGHNGQVIVDGQFTSAKVQNVILAIKDYDPHIEVGWVPPQSRKRGEPAFRVSLEEPGKPPFILFFVQNEDEFDERVLKRIIQNDQRYNKQTISDLEAWEQAQQLLAKQEWLDELEAANDIAFRVLRSNKNTYRVNKNLVVKDGIPHNAAHLDSKGRIIEDAPKFNIREEM